MALACSIADLLRKPVALLVTPIMVALMPKGYHKWINQIINLTLKAESLTLSLPPAWRLLLCTWPGSYRKSSARCRAVC